MRQFLSELWHGEAMSMRISEFWANVDEAFGSARGRSLATDLTITALDSRTAAQAIDEGVEPQRVWEALVEQMDLPEKYRFWHLLDPQDR